MGVTSSPPEPATPYPHPRTSRPPRGNDRRCHDPTPRPLPRPPHPRRLPAPRAPARAAELRRPQVGRPRAAPRRRGARDRSGLPARGRAPRPRPRDVGGRRAPRRLALGRARDLGGGGRHRPAARLLERRPRSRWVCGHREPHAAQPLQGLRSRGREVHPERSNRTTEWPVDLWLCVCKSVEIFRCKRASTNDAGGGTIHQPAFWRMQIFYPAPNVGEYDNAAPVLVFSPT